MRAPRQSTARDCGFCVRLFIRIVASFCSQFLTRTFMFSFFIFAGGMQHLYGKCFNFEFVMENRIILFVIAYAIAVFRTSDY